MASQSAAFRCEADCADCVMRVVDWAISDNLAILVELCCFGCPEFKSAVAKRFHRKCQDLSAEEAEKYVQQISSSCKWFDQRWLIHMDCLSNQKKKRHHLWPVNVDLDDYLNILEGLFRGSGNPAQDYPPLIPVLHWYATFSGNPRAISLWSQLEEGLSELNQVDRICVRPGAPS